MKLKKLTISIFIFLLIFTNILLISSCYQNNNNNSTTYIDADPLTNYFDPTLPTGAIEFTNLILDLDSFSRIIPLGNLNPPGHTFPTDHIYFVLSKISEPVYAPASGKILFIDEPNSYGDKAIKIGVTNTTAYYLGHIFISNELKVGDMVTAGEEIGISGNTSCVDFGVVNQNVNNTFINSNYPKTTLYGDKPLSFYTEPLRTLLYSLVLPPESVGSSYIYEDGATDGKFNYDILGTLSGNWFKEDYLDSSSWYEWSDTLSFCYDLYYPDQMRIAIGTWSNAFALADTVDLIKPENVTLSSGIITYNLYNANNTSYGHITGANPMAVMYVQMITDTVIKLEIFDYGNANTGFTEFATYYIR